MVNKNAIVAFGISHGGFLTTQLVVQFPVSQLVLSFKLSYIMSLENIIMDKCAATHPILCPLLYGN